MHRQDPAELDHQFARWLDITMDNSRVRGSDLARRLGVTDSAVSRWRNGAAKPNPDTTAKLAKIFGVDPMRLVVTAGHIDGSTVNVKPYQVPDSIARRRQAIEAFDQIQGLSESSRKVLLETYDEIVRQEK